MAIPSPIPHLLLLLFLPALPISLTDFVLYSGEVITAGQNLTNGDFQLPLKLNCDLIITDAGKTIWLANTSAHDFDCYLGFKQSSKLVVRHGVHYTLWSSGSKSRKGKFALLLDKNETTSGRILWQTNTKANGCHVQLKNNRELTVKHFKQKLWSSNKRSDNGAYIGVLRYDGRFVVYGHLLWNNDKKDSVCLGVFMLFVLVFVCGEDGERWRRWRKPSPVTPSLG